jgi:hypothetical protein
MSHLSGEVNSRPYIRGSVLPVWKPSAAMAFFDTPLIRTTAEISPASYKSMAFLRQVHDIAEKWRADPTADRLLVNTVYTDWISSQKEYKSQIKLIKGTAGYGTRFYPCVYAAPEYDYKNSKWMWKSVILTEGSPVSGITYLRVQPQRDTIGGLYRMKVLWYRRKNITLTYGADPKYMTGGANNYVGPLTRVAAATEMEILDGFEGDLPLAEVKYAFLHDYSGASHPFVQDVLVAPPEDSTKSATQMITTDGWQMVMEIWIQRIACDDGADDDRYLPYSIVTSLVQCTSKKYAEEPMVL